ncbi:MAG: glycosyltransferase [Roseburia sp.]|nr:glycosyltransferase [Roseburia sp.]
MKRKICRLYYSFKFGGVYYVYLRIFDKIRKNDNALKFLYKKSKEVGSEQYEKELINIFGLKTGLRLNFKKPQTFNEKIQWMKLYDTTPLKVTLTDKYLVREWVREKIGEQYLISLLGVWDHFADIEIRKLPDKFALKINHGSGWNLIVKKKADIIWEKVQEQFDYWMSLNYAYTDGFEMQYLNISPKIIAEEYIENENGNLYDYKIHCFNGIPRYIHIIGNRKFDMHCAKEAFYDVDWQLLPFTSGVYLQYDENIEKPKRLEEMLEIAKKLSEEFIYVRVDLYELTNGVIKFGEMTFTPGSGFYQWEPAEMDKILGEKIILPIKKVNESAKDQ